MTKSKEPPSRSFHILPSPQLRDGGKPFAPTFIAMMVEGTSSSSIAYIFPPQTLAELESGSFKVRFRGVDEFRRISLNLEGMLEPRAGYPNRRSLL